MSQTDTAPTRRTITVPVRLDAETRSDSLRISGHAAVFDAVSEDLGFRETLAPGCFRRALSEPGADPYLVYAHDPNAVLARRSAGTLAIHEDDRGLAFVADVVPTTLGRDVVTLVRSGHVDGCSFAFTVKRDEWTVVDGERHRRVLEVGSLPEITITPNPAYTQTSVRNRALAERIERTVAGMRRRPQGTADPYVNAGRDSFSFFRDKLALALESQRERAFLDARMGIPSTGVAPAAALPAPLHGSVEEARARLDQLGRHLRERRDLTTTVTAGGNFVPTGAPVHVAEAFAAAVRARGVLPTILPVNSLPPSGMVVETPRITTGTASAVQATENSALTEQSIVEEKVSSPVTTVAGLQDLSQQLLDRSEPGIDEALAIDLGRALAEDLDVLLLTGSGTAPYLRGLDNVSGITTVAYTDGTPTAAELWSKVVECAADVATALGSEPTHVLLHSRRDAWLFASSWASSPPVLPYDMKHVPVNAITTTAGASTNEDKVYVVAAPELPIYINRPVFSVNPDYSGSGTLTVRIVAYQYASALFGRRPEAIGVVSGTGLAAPATY